MSASATASDGFASRSCASPPSAARTRSSRAPGVLRASRSPADGGGVHARRRRRPRVRRGRDARLCLRPSPTPSRRPLLVCWYATTWLAGLGAIALFSAADVPRLAVVVGTVLRVTTTAELPIGGPSLLVGRRVRIVGQHRRRVIARELLDLHPFATKTLRVQPGVVADPTSGCRSQAVPTRTPSPIGVPSRIVTWWPHRSRAVGHAAVDHPDGCGSPSRGPMVVGAGTCASRSARVPGRRLASHSYDADDYIRDYEEFLAARDRDE